MIDKVYFVVKFRLLISFKANTLVLFVSGDSPSVRSLVNGVVLCQTRKHRSLCTLYLKLKAQMV